jgi:hypothetical protein
MCDGSVEIHAAFVGGVWGETAVGVGVAGSGAFAVLFS